LQFGSGGENGILEAQRLDSDFTAQDYLLMLLLVSIRLNYFVLEIHQNSYLTFVQKYYRIWKTFSGKRFPKTQIGYNIMASIVDVAKKAGVSVTTVSRVLNNDPHPVNERTRARVLEVAAELNFSPNALARALVSEKSKIIGVVVGDASDPYFATIVRGISDIAHEHDYLTIICNSDRIAKVELNYVRLLWNYRADGIVFAGGGLTDPDYQAQLSAMTERLKNLGVGIVALGCHISGIPQVNIDNRQAAFDITNHLINLGHQNIAYIGGPPSLTTSTQRLDGYKKALAEHNIPFDPTLVVDSDFTEESGMTGADRLIELNPCPTAIVGSNDRVAIGCLVRLKQHGIKIPDQISVAGIDDIMATQHVDPAITTIRIPMREMGRKGMQQLLCHINHEEVDDLLLLPHELIVRASTGPIIR
jgi:LacI family transcriptional regulator